MNLSSEERNHFLRLLLDFGVAMLAAGAEIHRVEDTLTRIARAYGAIHQNVFVITSSMVVTLNFAEGGDITQTRRIYGGGETDFAVLKQLNDLSRKCCRHPLPLNELEHALAEMPKQVPTSAFYIGSAIAASSFCIFFGGGLIDALISAIYALLVCYLQRRFAPYCPNTMIFNLLSSFMVGVLVGLTGKVISTLNVDKVLIGDIMLLIPGIALTTSIRDILVGDTIAGALRLLESLLWAVGLACGFMLSMWLIGGVA